MLVLLFSTLGSTAAKVCNSITSPGSRAGFGTEKETIRHGTTGEVGRESPVGSKRGQLYFFLKKLGPVMKVDLKREGTITKQDRRSGSSPSALAEEGEL